MLPDEPNLEELAYCSRRWYPGPAGLFSEVPRGGELGKGLFVKIVEEDSSDREETLDAEEVDWRG
jgi:hypothetical protein